MKTTDSDICPHCGKNIDYVGAPSHLPAGYVVSGRHPYVLGAALGQGGFGITYIALDMVTNERVAIKEYFPTFCAGRTDGTVSAYPNQEEIFLKGRRRFLDEAQVLKSLSDLQSVVNVMDFFEFNNSAYLVMEFLEGSSLKAHAAQHGKFPTQEFLTQIRPMLEDLERMHQRGVIHRDIAPDNIILLPDGQMKLIDFGAARSFVGDQSMTVVVKKGFAPVEQYLSKGSTASTDVYALAATIYYCITGTVPMDSAQRQYDGTPLPAPSVLGADIQPHQEAALGKALELQQKDRTQSIAELGKALFFRQPTPSGQQVIYRTTCDTVQSNCPVVIKSLKLVYDLDRKAALLQPVLCSLSKGGLQSITAELHGKVGNGSHMLLAQFEIPCGNIRVNEVFSHNVPVILPPGQIRELWMDVTHVTCKNGSRVTCGKERESILPQKPLDEALEHNPERLRKFRETTTMEAVWKPRAGKYHWQCTCGCLNTDSETECTRCNTGRKIQLDPFTPQKPKPIFSPDRIKDMAGSAASKAKEIAGNVADKTKEIAVKTVSKVKDTLRRIPKRAWPAIAGAAVLIAVLLAAPGVIRQSKYDSACKQMEAGEFEAAASAFLELEDFKDSQANADFCQKEVRYEEAEALLAAGKYLEAGEAFLALGTHSDSAERVTECSYAYGKNLYSTGAYLEAYDVLTALNDYEDSKELANDALYRHAGELNAAEKYHEAYTMYLKIVEYRDSKELGFEAEYNYALTCAESKMYQDSIDAFTRVEKYKDSEHQLLIVKYDYATQMFEDSMWVKAADLYKELDDYKDSKTKYKDARYQYAAQLMDRKKYTDAASIYKELGSYKESKTKYKDARYQYGIQLMDAQKHEEAVSIFEELKDYKKSKNKLKEAKYQYVLAHKYKNNPTTYNYLKSLKKAKYQDSAKLYDELFGWKVTMVAVNSNPDDYYSISYSVDKDVNYLHFQFKLEGGGPGEKVTLTHTVVWPGGSTIKSKWYWENKASGNQFGCEWDKGPYHGYRSRSGTLTIKVYNKETKEYLGKGSIKLT